MKPMAGQPGQSRQFASRAVFSLPFFGGLCLVLVAGLSAQPPRRAGQARQAESAGGRASEFSQGKKVYAEHCAICHYADSMAQKIGPGLKGLYRRGKFSNGRKVDDAGVTRWIEAGGENMPGLKRDIKPEEIRELIAYIRTL